jgi:hypothetical protein
MSWREPHCAAPATKTGAVMALGEAPYERERSVGDLPPAAVDGQRMAAVRHLDDLRDAFVALLLLEGRVGDRPRDRVILLARDEIGSGSTPRNGAGSIATEAAARPRPARIWVSRPPNECPITAGLLSSPRMISSKWSATSPTVLPANTSGWALASSTVSGSSGQPGVSAV